jgi:sigma-B regulation protein RsbU (phosphoserine phosphatase)
MSSLAAARIVLWTTADGDGDALAALLEHAGHTVLLRSDVDDDADVPNCALAVVEPGCDFDAAAQFGRRLRAHAGETYLPILYVVVDPADRATGLAGGADVCLSRPVDSQELLGQVRALLRIRETSQRLQAQASEARHVNRRLQQAYQRLDHELELARRIQHSFLPQTLPELPRARFAVQYMPCGRVGGDFYDILRLDENHVGFYVADAMGHGIPASLLTIYLKKGVRPKEITGKSYRLVPPEEVLRRLNHEMIEQRMLENSFITMEYALLNFQTGTLRYARAGHPLPLILPAHGDPELWKSSGPILGVFESEFPEQERKLEPGDKILFYTDGIDGLACDGRPVGMQSLTACALRRRDLPLPDFLEALSGDLARQADPPDDVTLLAVEWRE